MTNRLAGETSPYLLQHSRNPVDWYPWGPEALQRARSEDKPIFLSIGYSACHWCHVMERESFEDERTAALLNEHFVSIKVDREERPDLDAVYMEAVQALTGQGGWPLSVWLTPDGTPFFGGTYFPSGPRRDMPSFAQVLAAVADAWKTRRSDLAHAAEAVRERLHRDVGEPASGSGFDPAPILHRADEELRASVDRRHGGWGGAPKFPQPLVLEYLLARRTANNHPQLDVEIAVTLDAMTSGGIYDHIGGGFHRYSTDDYWLVPHFEKMLYDNAQLARCYVHAWQVLGKAAYRSVAEETLDYLLREMQHPGGGFFSAQDADTVEGEGAYFTWTLDEVREALDPDEAAAIVAVYGLTPQGNFEGRNILHLPQESPATGHRDRVGGVDLGPARTKLLQVRGSRPRPARDEKIIAGWNGLALAALADAAAAFDSAAYGEAAERTAEFIIRDLTLMPGNTRPPSKPADGARQTLLLHSWKDGRVSGQAFLDDYACVAEGFLALYRCTFRERWFLAARNLVDTLVERFHRPAGGFYDTSREHEALISRPRAVYDSPTPSGTSMAATVLLKMAAYTGENRYREAAEEALASLAAVAEAAPVMSGKWLSAALVAQHGLTEVVVVGDQAEPAARTLLAVVTHSFRPLVMLAARQPGTSSEIAVLLDREPPAGSKAAAWICRHSTCSAPITDAAEFGRLLGA